MDSKDRFSGRVDAYVKYRPTYPQAAINYLYDTVGFSRHSTIADVGAGTGIFSELLLERGSQVVAVEPNEPMREAAVARLGAVGGFRAATGSAEATGLEGQSVDFIVCAQSFHWFDRDLAGAEFKRILRPGDGKVVLIWNTLLTEGTPFREGYEQLLQTYGTDYKTVHQKNILPEALAAFFRSGDMHEVRFANQQRFDYEGLSGRLLSSSFVPVSGNPKYEPMMTALRELYDRHHENGYVNFDYETRLYWGSL
ncbi:class I SAM-dependent methyltransferase [Paenibacillus sp. OV219]|uniref:class I SAM-dependent methyltransferase n=1 Tax=Paenibacillus sp. OV219 TaxID=1884377 RepID=UPI0008D633CD|nr:class I SAM-dependent methyltransferase [Paenibacillus sp. OV219]SEN53022.1 Methyltransferase domain-containing protein [Paenibacillus sp. OV219]